MCQFFNSLDVHQNIYFQTEAEMKMKHFLSSHPELKDLLADYINNILLMKPENVLPFTMDYFQSLCPFKLAKTSLTDENLEDTLF